MLWQMSEEDEDAGGPTGKFQLGEKMSSERVAKVMEAAAEAVRER